MILHYITLWHTRYQQTGVSQNDQPQNCCSFQMAYFYGTVWGSHYVGQHLEHGFLLKYS